MERVYCNFHICKNKNWYIFSCICLQVDIVAEFEVDKEAMKRVASGVPNKTYSCTNNGGATDRGALGPFGFSVLANKDLTEQTSIFFYIAKDSHGDFITFFCVDNSR